MKTKKYWIWVVALILICISYGCTTIRTTNRQNLMKLSIGMSKDEVLTIMGTKTEFVPYMGMINNPYRVETLQGKDKSLIVLYYYTDRKRADNAITDDELTPLVFDNDKLIGWGLGFLEQNIQKYEIRFR